MSETRDWIEQMRTRAMVAGQCSVEGPETTASRMAAAEADFLLKCVEVWSAVEARHAEELATLRAQLAAVQQELVRFEAEMKRIAQIHLKEGNYQTIPALTAFDFTTKLRAALASPSTPDPQTCALCGKEPSDGDMYRHCGDCHWLALSPDQPTEAQ